MSTLFEEDPRRKALGYEFAETPTIDRDAIRRTLVARFPSADPLVGQVVALLGALDAVENFHKNCLCQRVEAESVINGKHTFWIDGIEYGPVEPE